MSTCNPRTTRQSRELEPLSRDQARQLAACELVISQGLDAFREVGAALAEIRDSKLYRAEHKTFEDYCRARWGIGKSHAHRLRQAAEIASEMSPIGEVSSEAHARALAAFPPHLREDILRRALETAPGGQLTAAHVMRTGNALTELEEAEPEEDEAQDEADDGAAGEDEAQDEADDGAAGEGEALSAAADRCTPPAPHAIERAADHFRKGGMHLRHCTDLDVRRALELHTELTREVERLATMVQGKEPS